MHNPLATVGDIERVLQDQNRLLCEAYASLLQSCGDRAFALPVGVLDYLHERCRVRRTPNSHIGSADWVRC